MHSPIQAFKEPLPLHCRSLVNGPRPRFYFMQVEGLCHLCFRHGTRQVLHTGTEEVTRREPWTHIFAPELAGIAWQCKKVVCARRA